MLDNRTSHSSPIIAARLGSYLKPLSQNLISKRFINRTLCGFWHYDEYGFIFKAWKQAEVPSINLKESVSFFWWSTWTHSETAEKERGAPTSCSSGTFREWAEWGEWDRRSGFRSEEGGNMALKCFMRLRQTKCEHTGARSRALFSNHKG